MAITSNAAALERPDNGHAAATLAQGFVKSAAMN